MQASTRAKELRRNQTEAAKAFWYRVRNRSLGGWKFRRQVPIGAYIADFVCMAARLIVEIDGGQHAERKLHDQEHECFLRDEGYTVVRFWNNDVLGNMDGVLSTLSMALSRADRVP
ncbi:MAG: DUF559 domain-containing protein [Desulfobacteraceae bacterium]|nr:DUF559 domain-containing protein [Desulfobacteraceae bacterium]